MIAARLGEGDGFTRLAGPARTHSVVSGIENVHVTTLITAAVSRNSPRRGFIPVR